MLYRRFAVVFISIAILIGVSRVIVTAHYPSDVVFGAFIGVFTALVGHVGFKPATPRLPQNLTTQSNNIPVKFPKHNIKISVILKTCLLLNS